MGILLSFVLMFIGGFLASYAAEDWKDKADTLAIWLTIAAIWMVLVGKL